MRKTFVVATVVALGLSSMASAQTITEGFTFAVATDGTACGSGSHYHSNTGGLFGNPAGKAEVGNLFSECVRGLSEYNLTGLAASPTAFVTFNTFKVGGLFPENETPFFGNINVVAYVGNNLEDTTDYEAASIGAVATFSTVGMVVGSTFSFDITSIFNSAIAGSQASLGIRLEREGESLANPSEAVTFDSFRLTTDNQTTTVPEPSTYVLMATGLAALALARRRRRHV